MPLPEPRRGLVISHAYLWHHEHLAGREEARKHRPCVIVLAIENPTGGHPIVLVAPVTHSMPENPAAAFELPRAVNRHLGLDDERSWVILDQVNRFQWPGFDLRPISPSGDRFTHGFLPPRLFDQLMVKLRAVWTASPGKTISRD
ncbi:MAG: growth inhibitor PemK [Acetobacteraceae bacterium]|nr:growth inhibitor PemK [Acetobacteraceae bacterium]